MFFLGVILNVVDPLGALPSLHGNNWRYLLITVINMYGPFHIMFHNFYFIYLNYTSDFSKSTLALGLGLAVGMHTVKSVIFLWNNDKFMRIYYRVKRIYDQPTRYRPAIREHLDGRLNYYTRLIYLSLFAGCAVVICTPVLLKGLEYAQTGAIVVNRWELPLPFANPFLDLESSPTYEIFFVHLTVSFTADTYFVFAVDLLFMGFCIHICGLFQELATQVTSTKDALEWRHKVGRREFRRHFKKMIDFQREIYGIVKDLEELFGGIYCVLFIGTIFNVCIHSYLATQNIATGRILFNLIHIGIDGGELFLFTACGSLITKGNDLVAEALWDFEWPNMEPSVRRDFSFMLMRTKKICRISFLDWILCSVDSLRFVVNASFNMFAVLQNIARRKTSGGN